MKLSLKRGLGMRLFAVALVLAVVLAAPPTYAQDPPPAQQAPTAPEPAFRDGFRYAYVRVQRIASESAEGRAANEKIKALQDQKMRELQERNKTLQGNQQRLEQGAGVLSDQARSQLQREIERQQLDLQRFTEDAQEDVLELTQQLQADFERKLIPVIDKLAREKQIHMVFNDVDSGLIWADPGMDLTTEVIRELDGLPASTSPGQ
jgi:outer membrane protein